MWTFRSEITNAHISFGSSGCDSVSFTGHMLEITEPFLSEFKIVAASNIDVADSKHSWIGVTVSDECRFFSFHALADDLKIYVQMASIIRMGSAPVGIELVVFDDIDDCIECDVDDLYVFDKSLHLEINKDWKLCFCMVSRSGLGV